MNIPNPCHENWDSMKIGLLSRHCKFCSKDVMDFTKMDRIEILKYLILNYEQKTCGRIYTSQLDYTFDELFIVIKDISTQTKNRNLVFYFLAIGTLLIASCNSNSNVTKPIESTQSIRGKSCNSKLVPVSLSKIDTSSISPKQAIVKGEIVRFPEENDTFKTSEIMPEFPGGEDSLMAFIQSNLQYPESEKPKGIEGRVVVSFIVKKDGSIKNAKIRKSISDSTILEAEALRVINKMPRWIPGSNNGKKVDIEFMLPITFEL